MIFSNEFHMLSQEGNLAQISLLSGIESLGKLNYDKPGTFYAAFFQLSIGIERLMKIAVIIDHKVNNDLANPPGKKIRNLGHDLVSAYSECMQLAIARNMNLDRWLGPTTVEHELLSHLSEFAKGSRYFNLDSFSEKQPFTDPLTQWSKVHQKIADNYISYSKQQKINDKAIAHCDRWKLYGYERSITGAYLTQVDCNFLYELFKQSNKYCVLTVFRLLKPFYDLLETMSEEIRVVEDRKGINHYTLPDMHEFFPFLLCDATTAMRRKKWVGIY